jgi:Na+-translocating ferredoxin:NAD+ oxidoreductase RnfC subunit
MLRRATRATKAVIGIKRKNKQTIQAVRPIANTFGIKIAELDDVYPSGDEVDLIYHVTGRQVPTGGIPLAVGVVVDNVETLYNLYRASHGASVSRTLVSVVGAVARPATFWAPVGMNYRQVIEFCGGDPAADLVVVDGGPMMGKVHSNLDLPLTKTCGGLIILPGDHSLIAKKTQTESQYKRIGKSVCDQCSLCTELCPRYLLGYPVKPHLVMRALEFSGPESINLARWAQVCCECNICSLYACPEDLNPRDMCVSAKNEIAQADTSWTDDQLASLTGAAHPMREYRQVPSSALKRRLDLHEWDSEAPFEELEPVVDQVSIPLLQHIGALATPTVKVGAYVHDGDLIGQVAAEQLGAAIHASMDGVVTEINDAVTIKAKR